MEIKIEEKETGREDGLERRQYGIEERTGNEVKEGVKGIVSVAPMVDRTDKYFRNFIRMIDKDVTLYTEMITAQGIINGDTDKLLDFSEIEKPLVLQIAATDSSSAYEAVKKAEKYDYDEINLNVGCPSDRISGNMMGAALMAFPDLVAEMAGAMRQATRKPVSIKHRIGIDGKRVLPEIFERTLLDKYEDMLNFVDITSTAGIGKYIVHGRIAILAGLDPKQNREIPPLRHEEVYRLKKERPNLHIEINGGIRAVSEIEGHLQYVDSVMIGREIYDNPMFLAEIGSYYGKPFSTSRKEIVEKMIVYLERMEASRERLHLFLRHTHGLFHGIKGSRYWKREVTHPSADTGTLKRILSEL